MSVKLCIKYNGSSDYDKSALLNTAYMRCYAARASQILLNFNRSSEADCWSREAIAVKA